MPKVRAVSPFATVNGIVLLLFVSMPACRARSGGGAQGIVVPVSMRKRMHLIFHDGHSYRAKEVARPVASLMHFAEFVMRQALVESLIVVGEFSLALA